MAKWDYLIEGDERLRALERRTGSISGIKAYIAELARVKGEVYAIRELIDRFRILPEARIYRWVVSTPSWPEAGTIANEIIYCVGSFGKGRQQFQTNQYEVTNWSIVHTRALNQLSDMQATVGDAVARQLNRLLGFRGFAPGYNPHKRVTYALSSFIDGKEVKIEYKRPPDNSVNMKTWVRY